MKSVRLEIGSVTSRHLVDELAGIEFEARNTLLFLMVENVHVFNCRSETRSTFRVPLASNWPEVGAVLGAQAVHIGATCVPGIREVLEIEPVALETWLLLLPVAFSLLLVMEIRKALWTRAAARAR